MVMPCCASLVTSQLCLFQLQGTFPCREMPVTLGHEFSGVVTSVGCDVTHLRQGDSVAVDPNRYKNDLVVLVQQ
jgi:Zn-dependent alcohol dehydrogenase